MRRSLAIELLTAAAGIDQRAALKPGGGVGQVHALIREHVAPLDEDRVLYPDIERVTQLIADGSLDRAVGSLQLG